MLGNNGFVLRCGISIQTSGEVLQSIYVLRKRSTDTGFVEIVSFPAPLFNLNYTLSDAALTSRTTITQPTTDASTSASLTFKNTECSDIAEYKWSVTYYYQTAQPSVEKTSDVKVQGNYEPRLNLSPGFSARSDTNRAICHKRRLEVCNYAFRK